MSDLTITRLLPNPAGKDRTPSNQVTNAQLNGEWVQFKNASGKNLSINGVSVTHRTFGYGCAVHGEDQLTTFNGVLPAGHSIRLHTGRGESSDDPQDSTLRHLFLNRGNFVWNNICGDRATLRVSSGGQIDSAYYDRNPPEGVVLERVQGTDRLAALAYVGRV
jgi:hypothetical protein